VRATILEVVDNQINGNNPKSARKAYHLLLSRGYSEEHAKAAIGRVVLETIYDMLKNNQVFDEADYDNRLDALLRQIGLPGALDDAELGEADNLNVTVKMIEYNLGSVPKQAIIQLTEQPDAAIPALIELLQKVRDCPERYRAIDNYVGCIIAAYLLAQFRAEEALPVLVDLLSLPGEAPFDLFGDQITEDMGRILASLCCGQTDLLKGLVENGDVNEYVRSKAVDALSIVALHEPEYRDEIAAYYRQLLDQTIVLDDALTLSHVVMQCLDLYLIELLPEINAAFDAGLVDIYVVNRNDVASSFAQPQAKVLKQTVSEPGMQVITDTIEELSGWACFRANDARSERRLPVGHPQSSSRPLEPKQAVSHKTGRNEPCPCGSGKKYKKCCGQSGR
jgi:HEAT repeat protein